MNPLELPGFLDGEPVICVIATGELPGIIVGGVITGGICRSHGDRPAYLVRHEYQTGVWYGLYCAPQIRRVSYDQEGTGEREEG